MTTGLIVTRVTKAERAQGESCLSYVHVELVRLGILLTRELDGDRALGLQQRETLVSLSPLVIETCLAGLD
jgi:hypothetical protein